MHDHLVAGAEVQHRRRCWGERENEKWNHGKISENTKFSYRALPRLPNFEERSGSMGFPLRQA
jgi:hypothetical protein